MRKEANDLTKSFPEDDFDLERLKWQTIAQKKERKPLKIFKPKYNKLKEESKEESHNNYGVWNDGKEPLAFAEQEKEEPKLITTQNTDAATDSALNETDVAGSFPEASFDLDNYKKNVITQKRERFWKRNTKLFYFLSTLSMIALFVIAYFVFHFISDWILSNTFLR